MNNTKELSYKVIYSYNPPKRKQSWVNKKFETQFVADNTYIHHSTYLDNPHISKAFIDEAEEVKIDNKGDNANLISAISQGAQDGLNMALGIGASLIAIIAIVALVNGVLGIFGLSLEKILSVVFAPIGFLMGLDMNGVTLAGQLLGSKLVLNEFVAFGQLGEVIKTLDPRTALMLSVSLCGFANISSMGICISGISVFCPEKRNQLSKLAFRGMIGGFIVSLLSALIVGLIMAI